MSDVFSHDLDDNLDPQDTIARDRLSLDPVKASLIDAGFYAYGMIDDTNRWTIAVDDELGRVDVHVGDDGLDILMTVSSPGLFADEESDWRRASKARLARIQVGRISRGLDPHQRAFWDDVDEGIAVSERYQLPFTRSGDVGAFVREQLPQIEELLERIERQLD